MLTLTHCNCVNGPVKGACGACDGYRFGGLHGHTRFDENGVVEVFNGNWAPRAVAHPGTVPACVTSKPYKAYNGDSCHTRDWMLEGARAACIAQAEACESLAAMFSGTVTETIHVERAARWRELAKSARY